MQILLYAISILSLVIGIDNETKHVSKANSITASLVYHQLPFFAFTRSLIHQFNLYHPLLCHPLRFLT
jgi:hypothetical protein